MRLVAIRTFNNILFFGYAYGESNVPYWTMRFYPEVWHAPEVWRD